MSPRCNLCNTSSMRLYLIAYSSRFVIKSSWYKSFYVYNHRSLIWYFFRIFSLKVIMKYWAWFMRISCERSNLILSSVSIISAINATQSMKLCTASSALFESNQFLCTMFWSITPVLITYYNAFKHTMKSVEAKMK